MKWTSTPGLLPQKCEQCEERLWEYFIKIQANIHESSFFTMCYHCLYEVNFLNKGMSFAEFMKSKNMRLHIIQHRKGIDRRIIPQRLNIKVPK